jgi:ABC-type glycerol-3-phosphate transport system substrate-binding protein
MKKFSILLVLAVLALGFSLVQAQDPVELRITWYDDGNEGEVLRDILDRFEEENPDITVVIDTVDYAQGIQQTLPLQIQAGEGPDIARITAFTGLTDYYLDMRDLVEDSPKSSCRPCALKATRKACTASPLSSPLPGHSSTARCSNRPVSLSPAMRAMQ